MGYKYVAKPLEGIFLELLCFSVFTQMVRMRNKVKKNDLTAKKPASSLSCLRELEIYHQLHQQHMYGGFDPDNLKMQKERKKYIHS